nr:retrovirus-related Pol polyprotein from transposon TNT 1-94 [Tanacetum cinerariifolium]
VIPITSVSRPQLKRNPMEDIDLLNNSQRKKQDVEDHGRNVKFSKNKTFVTACNDSLNANTLNVNFVCATCGKCVLNDKHDMCVLKSHNGVNSRTKMPMVVPLIEIILFIIDSGCSKYMTGNLKLLINFMEKFMGTVKFRNDQIAPILGYTWTHFLRSKDETPEVLIDFLMLVQRGLHAQIRIIQTDKGTEFLNQTLHAYFAFEGINHQTSVARTPEQNDKFMGTVKFRNDQIAPILGYGDLIQGAVTINRVYYVEGPNHNLFSVGQLCDADLEVAFRKSTCYIHDLKGNDLLTGSHGTDLYSITLHETTSPNPICLMAKATSSQAWLWHRRLSHLN